MSNEPTPAPSDHRLSARANAAATSRAESAVTRTTDRPSWARGGVCVRMSIGPAAMANPAANPAARQTDKTDAVPMACPV